MELSIAEVCSGRLHDRLRPFNDLHFVMALAMAERKNEARQIVASIEDFVGGAKSDQVTLTSIYENAALPVAKAIINYAEKNYADVVRLMLESRYEMRPLGGSWAQRDVWMRMLIDSAVKDNNINLSRVLLAERIAAQPTSGPTWRLYADTLEIAGDAQGAAIARSEADNLVVA